MKANKHYLKIVEWSEKDGCFVGTAPGLLIGGVHGRDEKKVFQDLCQAVDEALDLLKKEKRPLPPPTASRNYSGRILLRLPAELHQTLAVKALQAGQSLNHFIKGALAQLLQF